MSLNSWRRQEKKGKMRSFQETQFGMTFIIFEAKTKRGTWYRKGRIRIK